jgi:DNA-binding CsgD family transcriptional regulator
MPVRQGQVAEHRLRYQRSTNEIARVMQLSPVPVERHIRRITVVLRAELQKLLH